MDLCLASHRAVFKALQAFEDGELTLAVDGALTVFTTEGELRLLDGVCFAAPNAGWIGAELVGWLEELAGLSGVGAWWRPGLRAVLRRKDGRVDVTGCSQDLAIGGLLAASGFATHSARFIVAHGDVAPAAAPPPAPAVPLRERGVWPMPVYTPVPRRVRMLPRAVPPPRREARSEDRLSQVA